MKKFLTLTVALAVALWMSGLNLVAAQGHGNHGSHGQKPAQTGLEHAEATANPHGVGHGIEKAETKQDTPKHKKSGKAKGKHKAHHHNAASH